MSATSESPSEPLTESSCGATMDTPGRLTDHSLSSDDTTFDPSHPINANLKNAGVGLVPQLTQVDATTKTATLSAASIRARLVVPFGWHIIDDGRRTLIFEPRGHVQINMHLTRRENRADEAILDSFADEARASYPSPLLTRQTRRGLPCIGVCRIADGGQELEQYHLLASGPDAAHALHARVTTVPLRSKDACALADLILATIDFGPPPEDDPLGDSKQRDPGWWHRSRRLEAEGKFEEAEEAIRHGVDHIGAAASVAQMYAERMVRLKEAGDNAGALNAFKEADGWITFYASMATSGGEGAALSYERDRFRAGLVRMLGFDPKSVAMRGDG